MVMDGDDIGILCLNVSTLQNALFIATSIFGLLGSMDQLGMLIGRNHVFERCLL